MKYSKSAIGLLTREYRSVLKKCLLINLGLFALGAIATPANAAETYEKYNGDLGALRIINGTVDKTDEVIFRNNKSTSHGAGLYSKATKTGVPSGATFNGNVTFNNNEVLKASSSGSGAGAFVSGGNFSFLGANNSFTDNHMNATIDSSRQYKVGGGAVANQSYWDESTHAPIDATMVIGKADGSSVNTFSGNTSSTNGGAIMNRAVDTDGNATLTINGTTTFSNNSATQNGGAIYNIARDDKATGHIAQLNLNKGTYTFTGNQATNRGGAVYNYGTAIIDNAVFTSNRTTSLEHPSQGGAIYNAGDANYADTHGILTVSNTTFGDINDVTKGNSALYGGAIANDMNNGQKGEITLNNVNFYNNNAFADTNASGGYSPLGGAIYNDGIMTVNGATELKGNTAEGYSAEGGAIYNSGTMTVNDAINFTSNTVKGLDNVGDGAHGGAVRNVSTLTFKDMASFSANKALNAGTKKGEGGALHNRGTATFEDGVSFDSNEAEYGAAIFNSGTVNLTDASFTNNKAGDEGGAIFTLQGTVNINAVNKDVVFSGNTANGQANDITNYLSTINLNAASGRTISMEGIDGHSSYKSSNIINLTGAGTVEVSEYIANQTVNVNSGELHLTTGVDNLHNSTVTVASGAIINTIDDVINDYSNKITLEDGATIKGDVNFAEGLADIYGLASGATSVNYSLSNLIGSVVNGSKDIQVVNGNATVVISEGAFNSLTGITAASAGANGKITVTGMAGGIEQAADASANVNKIEYNLTVNEIIDDEKVIQDIFELTGDGIEDGDAGLELQANLGVNQNAKLSMKNLKITGNKALNNQGVLNIKDSKVDVDLNNSGTLISDPTTYSATVNNAANAFASFDADTFTGTATLANAGIVNLSNGVTFEGGAQITGAGTTNLASGFTHFNNTANANTINLFSGANFDGTLVGGAFNAQNGTIDTIAGAIQNIADVAIDVNTTSHTADKFASATGSVVKSINVLGGYGTTDTVDITLTDGLTFDDDVAINGGYYTDKEVNADGTKITLKDKLVNQSTLDAKKNLVAGAEGNGAHVAVDNASKNKAELSADYTTTDATPALYTSGINANANDKQVEISAKYYANASSTTTPTKEALIRTSIDASGESPASKVEVSADTINMTGATNITGNTAITGNLSASDLITAQNGIQVNADKAITLKGSGELADQTVTATKVKGYDDVVTAVNHATTGLAATKAIADANAAKFGNLGTHDVGGETVNNTVEYALGLKQNALTINNTYVEEPVEGSIYTSNAVNANFVKNDRIAGDVTIGRTSSVGTSTVMSTKAFQNSINALVDTTSNTWGYLQTFGNGIAIADSKSITFNRTGDENVELTATKVKGYDDAVTKLSGIATGAQVNVIESVKVNGTALTPDDNKAVNVTLADLGAQAAITTEAKLNSDLVTTEGQTNQFVTTGEKTTWNSKQNALTIKDAIADGDADSDMYNAKAIKAGLTVANTYAENQATAAKNAIEGKLGDGASGYAINAQSLQVAGRDVLTIDSVIAADKLANAKNAIFSNTGDEPVTIEGAINSKLDTDTFNGYLVGGEGTDATKIARTSLDSSTTASLGKADSSIQSVSINTTDADYLSASTSASGAVTITAGEIAESHLASALATKINGKFDKANIIVSSYDSAADEPAAADTNVYSALKTNDVIANAISAKDSVRFGAYSTGDPSVEVMPAFGTTETVGQYLYENAANALYDPSNPTKGTIKSNIGANATAIANALAGTTKFDGLKLAKNGTTTDETQTITSIDVDSTNDTTTANSAIMATKASVARDITTAVGANTATAFNPASYTGDANARIAAWAGLKFDETSGQYVPDPDGNGNYAKFANVATTFGVLSYKLNDFQNDLYTGNNKFGGKQSFGTYATAGDSTTAFTENAYIENTGAAKFTKLLIGANDVTIIDVDSAAETPANNKIMATKASVARDIQAALSDDDQDIEANNITAHSATITKSADAGGAAAGITALSVTATDTDAAAETPAQKTTTFVVNSNGVSINGGAPVTGVTTSMINSDNNGADTLATAASVYNALGKVHKLITHNDTTDKDVMDEDWAGKSHNVVSGEYRGNLAVGTTVADDLIELDNVFGKMQNLSGTDLVAYVKEGTDAGNGSVAENLQKLNDAIHGMTGTKESVTFGDAATTTTMGNTNAKIVLSESGQTATVTAANGLIVDGKVQGGSFRNTGNSFSVDSAGQVLARNFTNNSKTFSVSTGGVLKAEQLYNNSNTFSVSSGGALTANEYSNSDGSFVVNTKGDVTAHSLTFNGTDKVSTIDTGATAVSGDGSATTMATTATVMKSAANGKYDNTTSGLTATTIQAAIDENASSIATSTVMDANATSSAGYVAGDKVNRAAKLLDVAMKNAEDDIDDIEYLLGDAQTAAATSGILTGKIIGGKDAEASKNIKVVDAIDLIAKKAVGLDTANVFTNLNTFKYDGGIALQDSAGGNSTRLKATAKGLEVDRTVVAEGFRLGDNTVTSIDVDGSAVGEAAANANKMATGSTVYYGAKDANYTGTRVAGATSTATLGNAISEATTLANTIETKITVAAGTYKAISAGDGVAANLVALDSAVGTIQTSDTKQNKQLDTLATGIGGSYASDGTFTHTPFTSTNNISATDPITTAISSIDAAIGDAGTLNSGIAGYTGTEVVGAVKQLSANLTNGTVNANFGSTTVDSLTIDGTSYGITSGGAATFASVDANSVTTNSLKIGTAAAITATTTGLDMGNNDLSNIAKISFHGSTDYVNAIDTGTTARDATFTDKATTMATVATVLKSAENAEFTKSAENASSAALGTATTINAAINNVAAAVDTITDGMGNVADLATQAAVPGSNINNPAPGSSPTHAPTVVSAIKDLDNAIGNIETGITHDFAKNGGTVPNNVAGIIQTVAENVYAEIHGDNDPTTTDDVTIGDKAAKTTVGVVTPVGTDNYLTGLQVDTTDSSTTLAAYDATNGKMLGMEVDAKNQKIAIGDSADDAYGLKMDTANSLTSIGDGTDRVEIGKGTLEIGQMMPNTTAPAGTHFEAGLHMDKDTVQVGDMTTNGVKLDATDGSITTTGKANIGDKLTVAAGGADITGDTTIKGALYAGANGTEFQVGSTGHVYADGSINSKKDVVADGKVQGNTFTNTNGSFQVGSTGHVYAQALAFNSDQNVKVNAIDTGATPVTGNGSAETLATTATVMTSAENAKYTNDGTGVVNAKGSATLHDAIQVLDNAMGTMDLSSSTTKTFVDDTTTSGFVENATDALNALDGVVGNVKDLDVSKGNLHATNKDVASHLSALDARLGTIKAINGGEKGNLAAANSDVATHFGSLDTAIGNRKAYSNENNFTGYVAVNDGTKDLTTMISEVASNIGKAGDITSTNQISAQQTVNANLSSLDAAIGNVADLQQLGYSNVTQAIIGTDAKFTKAIHDLDMDQRKLRHDFEAGMAGQAALSALVPNAKASGNTQLAVGTGAYKGHTAAAVGGFHWFTDNLLFNAGVAWDNNEATGRMGITYSW